MRCVWLERFSPRKSAGTLRPPAGVPPASGGSCGLKLFIEAHASISVPSTEKCSLDSSRFIRGWVSTAVRNLAAISPSNSRSRFLEKVEMIPHRVIDTDPDKPAKQQIKLQSLHQLPLRTDRVERLQQHRSQQHLGCDRRSPQPGIQRREIARQRLQGHVRQCPYDT